MFEKAELGPGMSTDLFQANNQVKGAVPWTVRPDSSLTRSQDMNPTVAHIHARLRVRSRVHG